jgi:hypothetical protein
MGHGAPKRSNPPFSRLRRVSICSSLHMNVYEKALFVKPTWRSLCG